MIRCGSIWSMAAAAGFSRWRPALIRTRATGSTCMATKIASPASGATGPGAAWSGIKCARPATTLGAQKLRHRHGQLPHLHGRDDRELRVLPRRHEKPRRLAAANPAPGKKSDPTLIKWSRDQHHRQLRPLPCPPQRDHRRLRARRVLLGSLPPHHRRSQRHSTIQMARSAMRTTSSAALSAVACITPGSAAWIATTCTA
jgi:hypothetical protein